MPVVDTTQTKTTVSTLSTLTSFRVGSMRKNLPTILGQRHIKCSPEFTEIILPGLSQDTRIQQAWRGYADIQKETPDVAVQTMLPEGYMFCKEDLLIPFVIFAEQQKYGNMGKLAINGNRNVGYLQGNALSISVVWVPKKSVWHFHVSRTRTPDALLETDTRVFFATVPH